MLNNETINRLQDGSSLSIYDRENILKMVNSFNNLKQEHLLLIDKIVEWSSYSEKMKEHARKALIDIAMPGDCQF